MSLPESFAAMPPARVLALRVEPARAVSIHSDFARYRKE